MQVVFQGCVIAESEDTVINDGYVYFPEGALNTDALAPSDFTTYCPSKGEAHYYDVVVDGQTLKNSAFFYPEPVDPTLPIIGRVGFWTKDSPGPEDLVVVD